MITLDALVVSIAVPSIRHDLGGGITGLQWVLDGYTLMFATLLLSAGALADRVGARRAFAGGLVVFGMASAACGLAPSLTALVVARFVQGGSAAVLMPSSMSLIRQEYADRPAGAGGGDVGHGRRRRGVVGAAARRLLTLASWRMIFFVNVRPGGGAGPAVADGVSPRRRCRSTRLGRRRGADDGRADLRAIEAG